MMTYGDALALTNDLVREIEQLQEQLNQTRQENARLRAEASYYKHGVLKIRPQFVPDEIMVTATIFPLFHEGERNSYTIEPGKYKAKANQFGAVSVKSKNGEWVGVKLDEFYALSWRENTWWEGGAE